MHAQSFVGMSKKEAQDLAEKSNMIFRLVSVDGENRLGYPKDETREDRVCVELAKGKVVKAEIQ